MVCLGAYSWDRKTLYADISNVRQDKEGACTSQVALQSISGVYSGICLWEKDLFLT